MICPRFQIPAFLRAWQRSVSVFLVTLILGLGCSFLSSVPAAWASFTDDRFDGNIFALYAGNGSLVPPKMTLAQALTRNRPVLLVFYVDDSKDCKQYSPVISRLQAFYGRAADLLPINVDAMPIKASYAPNEAGYYYQGVVPQTVLFDQSGKVVLNAKGNIPFEQVDDVFREVFNLLPRDQSVELRLRSMNEFNAEIAQ